MSILELIFIGLVSYAAYELFKKKPKEPVKKEVAKVEAVAKVRKKAPAKKKKPA
jgi:uncharacterized membrane protein